MDVNRTGIYQNIVSVLSEEVSKDGGPLSVASWKMRRQYDCSAWFDLMDSDALRDYGKTARGDHRVLSFGLYADSSTLSKSGSQFAWLISGRPTKVFRQSCQWHVVGIAPHISQAPALRNVRMGQDKSVLFQ